MFKYSKYNIHTKMCKQTQIDSFSCPIMNLAIRKIL